MTVVHFDFIDNQNKFLDRVDVELLDTRGARAWAYAVLLNNSDRNVIRLSGNPKPLSDSKKLELLSNIHRLLLELKKLGYAYISTFPNTLSELTTDHFNQLHRHFTESSVNLWGDKTKSIEELISVNKPLLELNQLIHEFESVCITQRRIEHNNLAKELLIEADGGEFGYDIKPFRDHHSFNHTDVIINSYILGKSLIESYLCNDDPNAWDTSGNIRTNGGCVFLLTDCRSQLYQSAEFRDWLMDHNCGYQNTQADFPIGKFMPGQHQKAEKIYELARTNNSIFSKISITIT